MKKQDALINFGLASIFFAGLSQVVSYFVTSLATDLELGFADIALSRNPGLVFGLQLGDPWDYLIPIAVLVWVILTFWSWWPIGGKWLVLAAGMVVGGGVSNIGERVALGHVQDYFSVLSFPTFNMADVLLVAGLIIWIIIALFFFDEEAAGR